MTAPQKAIDVLIADDDADDRALTLRALGGLRGPPASFQVDDGMDAIDYLCRQGRFSELAPAPLPRLVLLDLKLRLRSGLEVLQTVRGDGLSRRVPIVVLTSSEHDRDIDAAYRAGANGYVLKPGVYEQYMTAIQQTARYWLEVNLSTG